MSNPRRIEFPTTRWKFEFAIFPKLVIYELKIQSQKTAIGIVITLLLVSLALIFGSSHFIPIFPWIVFENLAPLVLLFNSTALLANDRTYRTLETLFSRPGIRIAIYLRRLLIVYILNVLIVTGLALFWQIMAESPPVTEILLTSISPVLLMTSLGFWGAVLMNDANGGAAVGVIWWFLNRSPLLIRQGNQGWFGLVFLFKKTYYPHSTHFVSNRIALFLLGMSLIGVTAVVFRKGERFLL